MSNPPTPKTTPFGPYISLTLILLSFYACWFHLAPLFYRPFLLLSTLYTLLLFHLIRTSTDPSSSLLRTLPATLTPRTCQVCSLPKPPRFYHCRNCSKCHFRMDHHCYWIDNCVFFANTKVFVQFLVMVLWMAVQMVVLLLGNVGGVVGRGSSWWRTLGGVGLGILAVFVAFESWRLLDDQYCCVYENQTLIEGYKRIRGRKMGFWENFRDMFGDHWIYWLLPIQGPFNANIL